MGSFGDQVGDAISGFAGLIVLVFAVVTVGIVFAVRWIAEGAAWDAAGQAIGAAGGEAAQAAWNTIGLIGDIGAVIAAALVILGLFSTFKDRYL